MGKCKACGRDSVTIPGRVGFCAQCIRKHFHELWQEIRIVHDRCRRTHRLPEIPYRLLAFHPEFMLRDLPTTSGSHALRRCREAAVKAGLKRVGVGNVDLMAESYE